MQNYVEKVIIKMKKDKGQDNVVDLGTETLHESTMLKHLAQCLIFREDGRHPKGLRAALGGRNRLSRLRDEGNRDTLLGTNTQRNATWVQKLITSKGVVV